MDDKQTKLLKRVIKKLNALRSTLTKPERAILDALIVREPEVTGHAMTSDAVRIGEAVKGDAVKGDAVSMDLVRIGEAAKSDAMNADAAVAEAVIGLAATGYVLELR